MSSNRRRQKPSASPCPRCQQHTLCTIDSRSTTTPNVLRRRRYSCGSCGYRFTTYETPIFTLSHRKAREETQRLLHILDKAAAHSARLYSEIREYLDPHPPEVTNDDTTDPGTD